MRSTGKRNKECTAATWDPSRQPLAGSEPPFVRVVKKIKAGAQGREHGIADASPPALHGNSPGCLVFPAWRPRMKQDKMFCSWILIELAQRVETLRCLELVDRLWRNQQPNALRIC